MEAPPGSTGGANPSGWSNETLFVQYINHFIQYTKPSAENKVLIMDNHESHMRLDAINLAKKNHIIFLTLPPHTSHKLQPLDRTVFGPYKTYYNQAVKELMVQNHRPITIYNIAGCISKAYGRAFSVHNITKGSQVTGIYPLNTEIFTDDEFLPSYVTDRPINDDVHRSNETQSQPGPSRYYEAIQSQPGTSGNYDEICTQHGQSGNNETKSQPGPSNDLHLSRTPKSQPLVVQSKVSPEDIKQFPKAPERKFNVAQRERKKGYPYIN